jgi:hypothetical protein
MKTKCNTNKSEAPTISQQPISPPFTGSLGSSGTFTLGSKILNDKPKTGFPFGSVSGEIQGGFPSTGLQGGFGNISNQRPFGSGSVQGVVFGSGLIQRPFASEPIKCEIGKPVISGNEPILELGTGLNELNIKNNVSSCEIELNNNIQNREALASSVKELNNLLTLSSRIPFWFVNEDISDKLKAHANSTSELFLNELNQIIIKKRVEFADELKKAIDHKTELLEKLNQTKETSLLEYKELNSTDLALMVKGFDELKTKYQRQITELKNLLNSLN